MAIGAADLSAKAKRGWSWKFGQDDEAFSAWEAKLKTEIETQGIVHNIRRLEENQERKISVETIKTKLVDASDEQLAAAIAALS
jgi:hypothetical protein